MWSKLSQVDPDIHKEQDILVELKGKVESLT